MDVGQSVAVKDQAALAIEAVEGTDECIRRAGALCSAGGFSVVKVAKPQQDMRYDVPTVGMQDRGEHRYCRRRRAGHRGRPDDSSGRARSDRLRRSPRAGDRGHRRRVVPPAGKPNTFDRKMGDRKIGRKENESIFFSQIFFSYFSVPHFSVEGFRFYIASPSQANSMPVWTLCLKSKPASRKASSTCCLLGGFSPE